jgi:hypothetical protein
MMSDESESVKCNPCMYTDSDSSGTGEITEESATEEIE